MLPLDVVPVLGVGPVLGIVPVLDVVPVLELVPVVAVVPVVGVPVLGCGVPLLTEVYAELLWLTCESLGPAFCGSPHPVTTTMRNKR